VEQEQTLLDELQAIDDETRWRAVVKRDASLDGIIFYGVRSTGIYCKPSCPSKRPAREQVRFFNSYDEAEAAGFRSCLRCRPRAIDALDAQTELVTRACRLIEESADTLSLKELGARLNASPYYLQRTFTRIAGVSPRQYALAHRVKQFKTNIKDGGTVTGAMYDAGYGSSSRLYERSDAELGMTPASYARGGRGAKINYTTLACELGRLLVAATARGLCAVRLGDSDEELEAALLEEFPEASIERDADSLGAYVEAILQQVAGEESARALPLDVRATAFQRRVWSYLQSIPRGEVQSYGEVAARLGQPSAVRAVARACATNGVALVIPCHRVVRSNGEAGGYRWGIERKHALLNRERSGKTS
jgi:AraC family transcriptional regulator of adaptative response/methylated-DNA-[protein]-cysteine methyltransferase